MEIKEIKKFVAMVVLYEWVGELSLSDDDDDIERIIELADEFGFEKGKLWQK